MSIFKSPRYCACQSHYTHCTSRGIQLKKEERKKEKRTSAFELIVLDIDEALKTSHAKHSAHPRARESQPQSGYPIKLINNSATFLMFNSDLEKLLTHAFCQLLIAFIPLLSPL